MAKNKQVLALASLNVGHKRPIGPNQSRINQNFAAVGHAWSNLSIPDRAAWQLLANQMNHATGLRTAAGLKQNRPMTAFQCFGSLNGTLLACGQSISNTAPEAVLKPDPIPPVLLTATDAPSASETTTLPFTLTLNVPSFRDTLQVYAVAPLLAGQYPARQNAVIIGIFSGPFTVPLDLAPAFNTRFGPLQPGQQVALTLVPVNAQGFKGNPLTLSADVTAHAQATKRQNDQNRALKAA